MSGRKLQIRRGEEARLPLLDQGELAFTTDKEDLYVGSLGKNVKIAKSSDLEDLAGVGRTIETIKDNANQLEMIQTTLATKASKAELENVVTQVTDLVNTVANATAVNGEVGKSILRISHPPIEASPTGPLQMEFSHNIAQGDNFSSIKMYEESTPETDILTGREIDIDPRVLKLIHPNLTPNKRYISEIPISALKDRFGNVIKGIFTYSVLVKSTIQVDGQVLNFKGKYTKDVGLELTWNNPINVGLVGTKLMKSDVSIPTSTTEDIVTTLVQDGVAESYLDANVVEGMTYYYKLFPYDDKGNINTSASNELTIEAKQIIIAIVTPDASIEDINAMISSVPDDSEIIFTEGEFLLDSPLVITRSNISIKGQHSLTTLKCNFVDSTKGVIDIRGTDLARLSGIEINNLVVDGNKVNSKQSSGICAEYVGMGSSLKGVDSTIKEGIKILNCVIENNSGNGIYLNSSSNNTITGNTVQNNGSNGIFLNSSNNNTITGNTVQNNNIGIYLGTSNNNTIIGNTVQNNSSHGIYLSSLSNNSVIGNTVQNNGNVGIRLTSSSNNTVTGNTVQNNSTYGIYLAFSSNNTITGNISQNNSYGVYINGSNNTNNAVMSNILRLNITANYTDTGTGTLKYGNQELTS